MYIDTRELEDNSVIEGDICIVGAGAAGISIALEWNNSPFKVILLEGGGFEYDDRVQNLYRGKTTGQKYFPLKSTRLHYFGGTTNHWQGMCSTMDEIDFKKRDWVEYSGWPISKSDLIPYYDRSSQLLDLTSNNFTLNYWKNLDPSLTELNLDEKVVWSKMWQFSPPTRFGPKYRESIIKSRNIHLYTYANVTNISSKDNIESITNLNCSNYKSKNHKIKAKYYILACGAIQNARLLLASNKQAKFGLGNQNDLVGRFFMEHIEINSAELWLSKPLSWKLYQIVASTKARAELAIGENVQSNYKMLNGTASFTPLARALYEKSTIDSWDNEDPRKNEISTFERFRRKVLVKLKKETNNTINQAYNLFTRIEQAPNPNSRITIDRERDELGMMRANLHWELTSLEKYSIRKMYEIIGQQVGASNIGRVKLMKYLHDLSDTSWPSFTTGGFHHMGTTRMSTDQKNGVVDANCKVHSINNLFVAGSSCFTTSGAVNPTFTIVALSLRLSDHIKSIMSKKNT